MRYIFASAPAWIEAFAALVAALAAVGVTRLTYLTLIVLKEYAADTKTIAKASASQTETSQIPFLAMAPSLVGAAEWGMCNQGFGPAINISYSRYDRGQRLMQPVPPLAIGERHNVHNHYMQAVGNALGFEIQYESLSGLKYRTLITWGDQGSAVIKFERPAVNAVKST
jgi:hypothetical protein